MDFAKKNWWWILCLIVGAVGIYVTFFMEGEKDASLRKAREAKAAKAEEKKEQVDDIIDTKHEVVPNG